MTAEAGQWGVPIPAGQAGYLIATAARAPSVHNTQPWRFRAGQYVIELYADQRRKLRVDPAGREMLISCGAALFGLRLAVRSLGYLPVVKLLPDPARLRLLAGLLAGLQHDTLAEGATLALVDPALAYQKLADIVGAAGRRQDLDPLAR